MAEWEAGAALNAAVDRLVFGHTGHGYYGPPADPAIAWAHNLSVRYDSPEAADAAYRAYYVARYLTPESRHGVCGPDDLGFDLCYWQDGWGPRSTPDYSTEIADAWEVVEAMRERGVRLWAIPDWGHQWQGTAYRGATWLCDSPWYDSAPLALCHAALLALAAADQAATDAPGEA